MKLVWNRELKKLLFLFLSVFMAAALLANLCLCAYVIRAREQYNGFLASLFGSVLKAYPEVSEEELIQVLNGEDESAMGSAVLARYGFLNDYGSASFAIQERQNFLLLVCANFLLLLLFLTWGILLFLYLKKRQHKIYGLTSYMENLNRDNYSLDMEDNADDELSGLRNEVYKTMVLLREQAGKATEQKLALADSVANISHQLKTPLTSVTILMDNLNENPDMDKATRLRFMSEITRQLTGMSWLITTMLKISRLDAGVVELERTRLDVRSLVEAALQRLEIAAEWKNVSFSVNIPEKMEVLGDKKWMAEALINIIKNAVEHSPDGGVVEISGEENEVYTRIDIRDHGTGIGEEERRRLFERFYNGTTAKEDSTGIGLSLAKEVVERQGGYITIDSVKDGGTAFVLKFI